MFITLAQALLDAVGDEHLLNARDPCICIASCLGKAFILLVFFL